MPHIRTTVTTTVCDKCGAAMVLVGVWQFSAEDLELHMFRCKICANSVFSKRNCRSRKSSARMAPGLNARLVRHGPMPFERTLSVAYFSSMLCHG
jgi:hypothetical protein